MAAISSAVPVAARAALSVKKEVEASPIPAFSTALKVLGCCIPFVGVIPSIINNFRHAGRIEEDRAF